MRISDWSSDVCSSDLAMRHFESIVETNVGTGESAAALQTNLGYQKFFHDMGSMLLDIASLTSFTKDLLEKPLSEQGPGELLPALDGHLEAVKAFESLTGTVGGAVGVKTPAPTSDMAEQFRDAAPNTHPQNHPSAAAYPLKKH